ncbi:hypothetical protein ILYODFUR_013241 [Ilyodon furcidens]|uniref:Secreted protein n=1 Tax=Ilyodon furcidens TaxID=33524 RepID=A0ABV0UFP6_9TELE
MHLFSIYLFNVLPFHSDSFNVTRSHSTVNSSTTLTSGGRASSLSSNCQWFSGNTPGSVLSRARPSAVEPRCLKRASGKGASVFCPSLLPRRGKRLRGTRLRGLVLGLLSCVNSEGGSWTCPDMQTQDVNKRRRLNS